VTETPTRGARHRAPLAALGDRDTYRSLLFLGTALPFGIVWVVGASVGWGLAAGLVVTPLVVPVVISLGVLTGLAARAEAVTARQLLDVPCSPPRLRGWPGSGLGPVRRARAVVADRALWRVHGYLMLRFLVGLPVALLELSLVGGGLFLVTSPIHYRWVPQDQGALSHGLDFVVWDVDTLAETLLLVPIGLGLVVLGAALAQPLTAPWCRLTYRLLGGNMNDALRPFDAAQLRRALAIHGIATGGIAALLVTIWLLTGHGYFWPVWPILSLGLPLMLHTWVTLVRTQPEAVPNQLGPAFVIHAGVSAAIGTFLTLIWAVAGASYFWPIWPMLALLVPVLIHLVFRLMGPVDDAALRHRIDVLTTSRAGALDAQEEELRRIERDLHDGAQARLVALGMNLGMAEQKLATEPDRVRELLAEARAGAREALEELRDLARGIHPPILADRGLGAAVAALAARSPVRVNVAVEGERPPPAVESAAYFVASEALANASKHAGANRVDVSIVRTGGQLVVEVSDDGRGGADETGTGLLGLRRRVEALDGRLQVVSPEGGPTTIRAEMPCE
jgi:signal transduction histidine kinase